MLFRSEHINAYEVEYRATHPDIIIAIAKKSAAKFRVAHPERKRADCQLRRTRIAGGIVEKFLDIEIFERDNYVCGLCDESIDLFLRHPDLMSVSLDHILPVSLGGNHTRDNVQPAHLRCNLSKNNRVAA